MSISRPSSRLCRRRKALSFKSGVYRGITLSYNGDVGVVSLSGAGLRGPWFASDFPMAHALVDYILAEGEDAALRDMADRSPRALAVNSACACH